MMPIVGLFLAILGFSNVNLRFLAHFHELQRKTSLRMTHKNIKSSLRTISFLEPLCIVLNSCQSSIIISCTSFRASISLLSLSLPSLKIKISKPNIFGFSFVSGVIFSYAPSKKVTSRNWSKAWMLTR